MNKRTRKLHLQRGVTLIELLAALAILAMLVGSLTTVMGSMLGSAEYQAEHNALVRDAEFAMDRIVRSVNNSPKLVLPLADKSDTNWPEHIREQTFPESPPTGDSTRDTAVLAITLPLFMDLDFDGIPDADNDGDGLIDEDAPADVNYDFASGVWSVDDGGGGFIDESFALGDDDEHLNSADEDPIDGIDNEPDGNIDEDPPADMNGDGCPGVCGVDDDGDGQVDEGGIANDDEDGQTDEDWYDILLYYLNGSELTERIAVPWDESANGFVSGRDVVVSTIAENVTRFRVERIPKAAGQPQLVEITLELTTEAAGTVSVSSRVRVGGAL